MSRAALGPLPALLPAELAATGPVRRAFQRPARPSVAGRLKGWHLPLAGLLLALGVVVCRAPLADIAELAWRDEEYSHILLVPVVAAFLIYVRRLRLRHFRVSGTLAGPLVVLVGWLCNDFGLRHGVQVMWHGGAVLVLLGCLVSVLGVNAVVRFLPAAAVLLFLIPVPPAVRLEVGSFLQAYNAQIAGLLLELMQVDARVSGQSLLINGQNVTFIEACNGMRMVFGLILVTYAFAFGLPLRNGVRAMLLVASPLVALACNVLRSVPTVWMHGYWKSYAQLFHDYTGWLMLPLAFVGLWLLVELLRWATVPVERYTLAQQGR